MKTSELYSTQWTITQKALFALSHVESLTVREAVVFIKKIEHDFYNGNFNNARTALSNAFINLTDSGLVKRIKKEEVGMYSYYLADKEFKPKNRFIKVKVTEIL
jgi:hypothetical protein